MKLPSLLLLGALCLGLFAFCMFGFLAAFEEPSFLHRLPWVAGYWLVAGIALGGVVYAIRTGWKNRRGLDK